MQKLTEEQKRQIAELREKKDSDIDLSEMPEVTDWSRAEVGKFLKPKTHLRLAKLSTSSAAGTAAEEAFPQAFPAEISAAPPASQSRK
jgi:hypothetical protein